MHGTHRPIAATPATSRGARTAALLAWLALCLLRRRERRALQELTDQQLKDIGLSRADVERECRRRPWDGGARER